MQQPVISIITVVYNNADTVLDTLRSVRSQDYRYVEHIVVDGCSTDGTSELLNAHSDQLAHYVCEPDRGMYDAMNKGIALAKGDYVGILNADDTLEHEQVLSTIARTFAEQETDAVIGDIRFVDLKEPERTKRYYSSARFRPQHLADGFMPPHPTFYVRRQLYEEYGDYKLDYKIAADYELLVRFFLVKNISYAYIPQSLVKMRPGGVSNENLFSYWTLNTEVVRACRENGVKTNLFRVLLKYFRKVGELFSISRSRETESE